VDDSRQPGAGAGRHHEPRGPRRWHRQAGGIAAGARKTIEIRYTWLGFLLAPYRPYKDALEHAFQPFIVGWRDAVRLASMDNHAFRAVYGEPGTGHPVATAG
jgi:hypothetical protein